MVYRIVWKERYKMNSYIACRDGNVVEVSGKRIAHFKGKDIFEIQELLYDLEASISCVSQRTKL